MSMADLERALELLRPRRADMSDWGRHDEGAIAAAEATLGLRFPPTYRRFVAELGALYLGDDFYLGLAADSLPAPGLPDVVWFNQNDREQLGQPQSLLAIHTPDDEPTRAIDTARVGDDRESPVIAWWPDPAASLDSYPAVATDFGEYLRAEVEYHLE